MDLAEPGQEANNAPLDRLSILLSKGTICWLHNADKAYGTAVAAAYGWVDYYPGMQREEIRAHLFALNEARVLLEQK